MVVISRETSPFLHSGSVLESSYMHLIPGLKTKMEAQTPSQSTVDIIMSEKCHCCFKP